MMKRYDGVFIAVVALIVISMPFIIGYGFYARKQFDNRCVNAGGEVQDVHYGKICWTTDGRRLKV